MFLHFLQSNCDFKKMLECTPDILNYASNLNHAIVKLQATHTTRYSQLGRKPQDPRTKTKQGLVRKSATS
jgi:hypothetical protein